MKYLFFDIECCDGHHICEFGYVLIEPDKSQAPFLGLEGEKLFAEIFRGEIGLLFEKVGERGGVVKIQRVGDVRDRHVGGKQIPRLIGFLFENIFLQ